MDNILPAQPIEITRSIKEKIFIILWSWFLLVFVYQNIIYGFIEQLQQTGKINFGEGFSAYQLIWGSSIFPNAVKLITDIVIATLGGMTVGYLLTRVRITFKFLYAFLSTVFQICFFMLLMLFIMSLVAAKSNYTGENSVGGVLFYIIETIRHAPMQLLFLCASFISIFLSYYFGMNLGMKFREDNFFGTDVNRRDTFLDIKWKHWLWFFIPVGIYFKIILNVGFYSITSIIDTIKHWKIIEIFGIHSSSAPESSTSILGIIFWGYLSIIIFFYQLKFVWDILTGRKHMKNQVTSVALVVFFSFISPFLIMFIVYWLFGRK